MKSETNSTVLGTVKQIQMYQRGSWDEIKMSNTSTFGKSPVSMGWKDDTMSERHEELLERFPSKDIGDIRKLENTLKSYSDTNKEDIMDDITELCLENDIISPEILLMDVMFKNGLKTASRNGITILKIDGSFEIRNKKNKCLSPEELSLMEEYLVDEKDKYTPPGSQGFQGGVDWAKGAGTAIKPGNYNIKSANIEIGNDMQDDSIDAMKVWLSQKDKEISFEATF